MARKSRGPVVEEGAVTRMGARRESALGRQRLATAGALGLLVLFLHAACTTPVPMGGRAGAGISRSRSPTPPVPKEDAPGEEATIEPGIEGAIVFDVAVIERGRLATRPVPIGKDEFRRGMERLAPSLRVNGKPQEVARELLKSGELLDEAQGLKPVSDVEAEGQYVAESDPRAEGGRGKVYSLVPVSQTGPVSLTPEAEAALRASYERWCLVRGGGDCLGLLEDGPYLRSDDRRTLALALAFGSVLDETYAALGRELSPRAVMASLMWAVGMYLGLWLLPLPEPATKGVAAAITVLLVAWLGVDIVWGLLDGWAVLAMQAREATTFDELREAGAGFARVLGTNAARAMILAVTALTGRTVGEVAALVRSLPGYSLAQLQFTGQGGPGWMLLQAERVQVVAASAEGALSLTVAPEAVLAGAMMSHNGAASTASGWPSSKEVYRHRGGNRQVEFNDQRWHLPRGSSVSDIPTSDPLGDELQAAVRQVAAKWGPERYTPRVRAAIVDMLKRGLPHRADLLERQARGRWVEEQMKMRFPHLGWNHRGVDITGPSGQKYHYEILSGTDSNFELHGRRMASTFFRMIFF